VTGPPSARQRLGDADRDRTAEALGRHFVEGRLDADGLGERVERLYAAEFQDEADALLADLPPLPTAPAQAARSRRRWLGRRHGEADAAQPGWRPTPERFLDPTTDRVMRVWLDPADSKRHYVAET
jgi:Domain of unknown function (DUF1707)